MRTELINELKSKFNDVNDIVEFKEEKQPTHGVCCAMVLNRYPVKVVTFDTLEMVKNETADYIRVIEVDDKVYQF